MAPADGEREERREVEEEDEEGRRPRMMANPRNPSRAEVDEHMATHLPYRAWCPHCVVCGGRDRQHFLKDGRSCLSLIHI